MESSDRALDRAIELGRLDATAQARLVRIREVSRDELVEAAKLRIVHANGVLNAVCWNGVAKQRSSQEASIDAPLCAAPVLLKDSLDCVDFPSRAGSRATLRDPPAVESPFVRALRQSRLAIIGKSSMPEFGLLPSTEPLLYGPTRNPWSLAHSPGGSSGGAAAAVAAGLVPLAHASDGAGSIRIPASCCGIFGFKPSRGANLPARNAHPIEDLTCSDSLLSRSVRDAANAHALCGGSLDCLQRTDLAPLRIGFTLADLRGKPPDPDVRHAVEGAARLCEALGHRVISLASSPEGDRVMACIQNIWGFLGFEALATIRAMGLNEGLLEPWTRALAAWGTARTRIPVLLQELQSITENVQAHWPDVDVLLSPVSRLPPARIGELNPCVDFEDLFARMFDYVSYTPLANIAGLPSMSMPLYWTTTGLPIGVLFTGRRGDDTLLFSLARQIEEADPWTHRWPSAHLEN